MDSNPPPFLKNIIHWWLLLWVLALVGYFSPWISRQPFSAALNWNAYDLYDAVMLLPDIETGAIRVNLQTLRMPLLGLGILLVLHLMNARLSLRLGGALLGGILALMTLPPYPIVLTAWRTPGWCVPFWWAVMTGVLCVILVWLPSRIFHYVPWITLIISAASVLPAAVTLSKLLPALRVLHDAPVGRGRGFWMTELGMVGYGIGFWWMANFLTTRGRRVKFSEKKITITTVQAVKARYEAQLLTHPNVVAVGIGMRAGHPEPVIIVSVVHKDVEITFPGCVPVPRMLEGIAVYIEEIGEPVSQA
jgi:hypothetical protein